MNECFVKIGKKLGVQMATTNDNKICINFWGKQQIKAPLFICD